MTTFYSGLEVRYKQHVGFVDFICEKYITICLKKFEERSRNVCLLVYPSEWKEIELLKQSDK
jgi:hypothetical protein